MLIEPTLLWEAPLISASVQYHLCTWFFPPLMIMYLSSQISCFFVMQWLLTYLLIWNYLRFCKILYGPYLYGLLLPNNSTVLCPYMGPKCLICNHLQDSEVQLRDNRVGLSLQLLSHLLWQFFIWTLVKNLV